MTDRRTVLTEYKPAPIWALQYVGSLMLVTNHQRAMTVVVAPMDWFASIPKSLGGALGACIQLPDGGDVIVLPDNAEPTEFWFDVLAHEFAHALHGSIDRLAVHEVNDPATYEKEVEAHVTMLGGLVQFAAAHGTLRPSQ